MTSYSIAAQAALPGILTSAALHHWLWMSGGVSAHRCQFRASSVCYQVMHMDSHEFKELEKVEPPDSVPEASTSQTAAPTGVPNPRHGDVL